MFLVYGGKEELVVTGYTDASFQTDPDELKSQSGFVFTINDLGISDTDFPVIINFGKSQILKRKVSQKLLSILDIYFIVFNGFKQTV